MTDHEAIVADLKRDLQDGDDLATAVAIVSDAVQRRIRRVQRSLDLLGPEAPESADVRRRLEAVLDRYQSSLDVQSRSLRAIVDEYQPRMDVLADELTDVETD